jgi:hypothetical protein
MRLAAPGRRAFVIGLVAAAVDGCAPTLGEADRQAVDALGHFEHVPGRAGVVVAAPHGTADGGSLEMAREIRARTGASAVLVTGFWDGRTRRRINVNRDTEQTMGARSVVLEQAYSARAAHVNARYTALVREAAQGPLRWFFEIHSNNDPDYENAVAVSTLGIGLGQARRFKERFVAGRDRHVPPDGPRLEILVAPADRMRFSFQGASSISRHAEHGFLIESPSVMTREGTWRARYAAVLADVITALVG